ncbi:MULTISPECIES: hypothetical protein [Streptomyces]|uniref:hypothetical protein n=1 Tax=Streptomyces TaxID=1883 RepID=UPI00158793EC|nr:MULTISPECIES: hypothetical protein [Streptomyces]MCX5170564.1 hypothetical protein [Streptomyces antibioticus]NUV60662.1 hypothetical protein [Streptomyces sp. CAI-85]
MTSDAEKRLIAGGLEIEEVDFGREDEPDIDGCALLSQRDEGLAVRLVIRPGLASEFRAGFAEWALQRIERFEEHGPEPDGWQKRSDGDWQLWVRRHVLPSVD